MYDMSCSNISFDRRLIGVKMLKLRGNAKTAMERLGE